MIVTRSSNQLRSHSKRNVLISSWPPPWTTCLLSPFLFSSPIPFERCSSSSPFSCSQRTDTPRHSCMWATSSPCSTQLFSIQLLRTMNGVLDNLRLVDHLEVFSQLDSWSRSKSIHHPPFQWRSLAFPFIDEDGREELVDPIFASFRLLAQMSTYKRLILTVRCSLN